MYIQPKAGKQAEKREEKIIYMCRYTAVKHNEKFEAWKTVSLTLNKTKYTIQK